MKNEGKCLNREAPEGTEGEGLYAELVLIAPRTVGHQYVSKCLCCFASHPGLKKKNSWRNGKKLEQKYHTPILKQRPKWLKGDGRKTEYTVGAKSHSVQ